MASLIQTLSNVHVAMMEENKPRTLWYTYKGLSATDNFTQVVGTFEDELPQTLSDFLGLPLEKISAGVAASYW